jgi:Raf kinase inhibitor-like YbhB/YbcL family protein
VLFDIISLLVACSATGNGADVIVQAEDTAMTIEVSSPAFENGSAIPSRFTCDGLDISPELAWQELPEGTESLALIMDDPDAPGGTWVHWVVFNMPADLTGLPEDVGRSPGGGVDGNNSWKRGGYGGPCPPQGTHRYFFKLYALDAALELQPGVTKGQVMREMEGHVLAEGQLMGTYSR